MVQELLSERTIVPDEEAEYFAVGCGFPSVEWCLMYKAGSEWCLLRLRKMGEYVNTTGPEKESSQNRTGGVSEGKAPFRNLSVRRTLSVRT